MTKTHEIYADILDDISHGRIDSPYATRLISCSNGVRIILGVDTFTRLLSVCLNLPEDIVHLSFPRWKGLKYDYINLPSYPDLKSIIRFSQDEDADPEIFELIVEDLRKNIDQLESVDKVVTLVQDILNKWRKFFQQNKDVLLSPELQQGLYGELCFLEECLDENGLSSVKFWSGPDKESKDFFFPSGSAVEVKTSSGNKDVRIHISNTEQLDYTDISGSLILRTYVIRKGKIGYEETLPAIISRIRIKLDNDISALDLFEDKLFQYGYLDIAADCYDMGYYIKDAYYFVVSDGFPRILKSDLTDGVCDVLYSINLSTCMSYAVTRDEAFDLLKGGVNG